MYINTPPTPQKIPPPPLKKRYLQTQRYPDISWYTDAFYQEHVFKHVDLKEFIWIFISLLTDLSPKFLFK